MRDNPKLSSKCFVPVLLPPKCYFFLSPLFGQNHLVKKTQVHCWKKAHYMKIPIIMKIFLRGQYYIVQRKRRNREG